MLLVILHLIRYFGSILILAPAVLLFIEERYIHSLGFSPLLAVPGILLFLLGIGIYIFTFWQFFKSGKGAPAYFDPPKKLVTTGLYNYSRHPMALATVSILFAISLLFSSILTGIYAVIIFIIKHYYMVKVEEPVLIERFGDEYRQYMTHVRRWL